MSWISKNAYLSDYEQQNNAALINMKLRAKGWSVEAIAALLGNMESESTINPGIWQSLDEGNIYGGFGLVQWTPATNFTDWATEQGYEIDDGDAQLIWIDELTDTIGQWIPTDEYNFSFADFKTSTSSPEYLASAFLKNFERAGVEVEENRRTQARKWYDYINFELFDFIPRKNANGIRGDFHYYKQNPFYQAGYGLPNCTCYAWGRFWEISDETDEGKNKPTLHTGDAGTWYENTTDYAKGKEPQLGAVVCWYSRTGGAGHVAIVEEILENGNIITSNSAFSGKFFYIKEVKASDNYDIDGFFFQGFIYNPFVKRSGEPDKWAASTKKKNKYKFFIFES